jgi:aminoglycoside/choline kinase family phosphotransferase
VSDRDPRITRFLESTPYHGATRARLAGDASMRRYERLTCEPNKTAVLMISPPGAQREIVAFTRLARFLKDHGLSAPQVYAEDSVAGLLLLEDLGDDLVAHLCDDETGFEDLLYSAAADCLAMLHRLAPPDWLARFEPNTLAEATDLATIWYAAGGKGNMNPDMVVKLQRALEQIPDLSEVLVLRDFHAENLIWLPKRSGSARLGLLDFQDALVGHRAYDLVSLLQDARRDLSPGLADHVLAKYTHQTGTDPDTFRYAFAVLGAQRNLRILGVFARLSLRDKKHRYLTFLPRVWGFLMQNLADPALADLREVIVSQLPAPTPDHLRRLAS